MLTKYIIYFVNKNNVENTERGIILRNKFKKTFLNICFKIKSMVTFDLIAPRIGW